MKFEQIYSILVNHQKAITRPVAAERRDSWTHRDFDAASL
jgi:hypothetical protein